MLTFAFRLTRALLDLAVVLLSLAVAFLMRFDFAPPAEMVAKLSAVAPLYVVSVYVSLQLVGVLRSSWRFVSLREALRIALAVGLASGVLLSLRLASEFLPSFRDALSPYSAPIGVIALQWPLTTIGLLGIRTVRRLLADYAHRRSLRPESPEAVPTLLIGAGRAGLLVLRELQSRPDLGLRPVGFIDDDPAKIGTTVLGVRVLGGTDKLRDLAVSAGAEQALITIANAPGEDIRRISRHCEQAQVTPKIIPGLYQVVGGEVNISSIRRVRIEDLLRRKPVELQRDDIFGTIRGKCVLVTGAGGSIGSELCRQLVQFSPRTIVLAERSENALFNAHRTLLDVGDIEVVPAVADVCDSQRMRTLFHAYRPEVVFHAAAHKHVPLMEQNPGEAIKNNVFGTRSVAELAGEFGAERFVLISTDKAVNPTSMMGATKRLAEIQVQALDARSKTRFSAVRFGNVLGSAGSVVPIFQEQIRRGGPITVTHPDMRRYFMTIPEACQLVLQASAMGKGGEIFILDMGEPVKIVDLARDLITLSGLRPERDIAIEFSGMRPGEKLYEELATDEESADKTVHPKIFVGRLRPVSWSSVEANRSLLAQLLALDMPGEEALYDALVQLIPEGNLRVSSRPPEHSAARPMPEKDGDHGVSASPQAQGSKLRAGASALRSPVPRSA